MNLIAVSKSPAYEIVVECLPFLTVWISDTVNMVLSFFQFELRMAAHAAGTNNEIYEVNNFWYFLRRVNFILIFFQEELASFLSEGNPFFGNLES